MAIFKLIVQAKDPKKLGSFLLKHGFSRQALNKAKHHHGGIYVNHKRRYTSFRLHAKDQVLFLTGEEKKNKWLKPSFQSLNIVKETKNYLIVNKEAGVLSIPSRYEDDDALVNRTLGYFERRGWPDLKPHVVTRLDRNTSGLVLIGKNAVAHARFSQLNKEQFVKKYWAVVHGNFSAAEEQGMIDQPIGRKGKGVKRSVTLTGQKSLTAYRVLEQVPGASLVELRLYTGRTHQIRVHMAYLGHVLYGDKLYGARDAFPRQALHCNYLAFPDPFAQEQTVSIKIDLAKDIKKLWQDLQ